MKQAKKLFALLLTVAMVAALAVPVFAEGGTGEITVDNPMESKTYTAYKIFDVAYNADKTAYAYTIAGTSEWFDVVATKKVDGTVESKINGLTFEKAFSEDTYVVTKDAGFSAPAFAVTLNQNTSNKTGTVLTVANGKATATGLDLGYYFVSSGTGALCNLTTTNPSVIIHDKNDVPFEKVDDKDSVEIGETVTYTITGKVPDTTGFESYIYKITDTMSEGLTFNKDVIVKVGNTDVTDACTLDYKPSVDAAAGFELTIHVKNYQMQIGAAITVTYTATVNENAVAKIERNHAILTYSNDPTDSTKTTTTPPDEETVYSAKIVIDKYAANPENAGDTSTKLAGAKFVLYKEETAEGAAEATKMYYKYTAAVGTEKAKVEWVADKAEATEVTTGRDGAANFDGLKDGIYYLEETAAPAGYNLLKEPVEITISGTSADLTTLTQTASVANNTGAELPSTGGPGTTLFYILGGILVVVAGVLLVTKKRMSAEK